MWSDVAAWTFRLAAALGGALTVGGAVFAAFVIPGSVSGALDPSARAALRPVRLVASGWAVAAAATALLLAARTTDLTALPGGPPPEPTAWLISAVLATSVAVTAWISTSWRAIVLISGVALVALLPPAVVGRVAVGSGHDLATDAVVWHVAAASVWTGSAAALLLWLRRGRDSNGDGSPVLRRYRRLRRVCAVAVVLSGGVGAFVTAGPGGFTTGHGLAVAAEPVALAALFAATGRGWRRRGTAPASSMAGGELLVLVAAPVLSAVAAPTSPARAPSAQIAILGYQLPGPPSVVGLLLHWRPDLLFGPVALLAVAGYLVGVRRLRSRGDTWPPGRVVAWLGGWALIVVATSSGLAVHAPGSFSLHMAVHLLLNMLGPALLAIAGPVTLALRALPATGRNGPAGPRAWLVAGLHAAPTRFAAHPVVAFTVFVGSYYLLYFTPLFPAAMLTHWAHQLMNIHFVLAGYLYYWVVVGTDPTPRPLPHLAKLGLLFAASPFHILFAVLVLNSTRVIGEPFYRALELTRPGELLADQRLGAAVLWAGGELPLLITVVVLVVQWSRHDDRRGRSGGLDGFDGFDDHHALLDLLAARRVRS